MNRLHHRSSIGSKVAWITGLTTVGAAVWALRDYSRWTSLGPGGLPANVRGWLTMTRLRFIAKNELDVSPIYLVSGAGADLRAWTDVRQRAGRRPTVSPYPIPHRQIDQLADDGVRTRLVELFDRKVNRHADIVTCALSHFEKRHPAITLKSAEGTVGARSYGEIAHIHPSDNSMHMILSPGDAVAAIEAGWGQRHGLAGIAAELPLTYVMIYSPRNEHDLEVVGALLDAAITYATLPDLA